MDAKKIYKTRQKDEITRCLSSFGEKHFTAADVVARLAASGSAIGQATVYRTIDRLAASGELRKYIVDGSTAACYQKSGGKTGCREHFHLKCEGCGRLIHVECDELAKIASHMEKEHGFAVDSSKTVFYGICRECRKIKAGENRE